MKQLSQQWISNIRIKNNFFKNVKTNYIKRYKQKIFKYNLWNKSQANIYLKKERKKWIPFWNS